MNIGIDLGGTNIAAAVVDRDGAIIRRTAVPTPSRGGAKAVTDGMMRVCEMLSEEEGSISSIGIGIPGIVNNETGEILYTTNLPLDGTNIAEILNAKFHCPVYLENDANCAALGETIAGGTKGAQDVVFITLGTGIGGGIIIGGRLLTGINGAAGEIGHMVVVSGGRQCECGRKGCWERYASATGIARTANEFMETHRDSVLWKLCGGNPDDINGKNVFDAYHLGDRAAEKTVGLFVEHLAEGVANIINFLEPDMFCIGGGLSNEWDSFVTPLLEAVNASIIARHAAKLPKTRIVKATLGNDAGIIGAAMLGA